MATRRSSHRAIGSSVYDIVKDLRADTASLTFPIDIRNAAESQESRRLLLAQLDDHLIPRLAELSTPAIVVIAGSTGAGKSTITNSLVGQNISPAGIVRPTTLEPVLIVHPKDVELMAKSSLIKDVTLKESAAIPRGVALLDAPDLDSVRKENRKSARRLLESADLWLFVTTAQRYGDALPWKTLTSAADRGTSIAMILNRVPAPSVRTIVADLKARLSVYDLGSVPLFVIEDQGPSGPILAKSHVKEVSQWLGEIGGSDQAEQVIVTTLKGALAALPPRLLELADATDAQVAARKTITVEARRLLVRTVEKVRNQVADQALFAGAGESVWSLFKNTAGLDKAIGRSGYARSSGRLLRARESAAATTQPALLNIAIEAGKDTIELSRSFLKEGLAEIEGGRVLDPGDFPNREVEITEVIESWGAALENGLESFCQGNPTKQVSSAQKAFGISSLATIVTAAVLGETNAQTIARTLLGNESEAFITDARAALADHYDRLILGEYVHVTTELEKLGLKDGSSARIRVRLAELKKLR